MTSNFFYSINVNDRVRFPVLSELKKEPVPNESPSMEVDSSEVVEEISSKDDNATTSTTSTQQKMFGNQLLKDEGSYFEAFKQTNCEKGLYCDEILKILEGFFQRVRVHARPWRSLQAFLDSFSTYVHNHSNEVRDLMDTMNTKRLITPYIELDLPVTIIEEFNQLEQGDPRIHLYQLNPVWGPAIKEFGFFWERYESTKEVLCMFIWSTIDQTVVPMPAVGLNPYPLCWVCDKGFGTLACTRCQVAKYCSKECLQKDWIRHGGPVCDLMASCLRRVKQLTFKRPPSPQNHSHPQNHPQNASQSHSHHQSGPSSSSTSPASSILSSSPLASTTSTPPKTSSQSSASSYSSRSPTSSPEPSLSASPTPSPPSSPHVFSFSHDDELEFSDSDPPFTPMEYI